MFYLALHGETEWNRARRFQGHLDSPLTEHGVRQGHHDCQTNEFAFGAAPRYRGQPNFVIDIFLHSTSA